ncbi:hypothetical protein [Rubinisphaera margarita]|uniref:hypothetical protein n=1 Tax=Rubinisphaera margarita TaxID=2909586 RepID=UPI001EE97BF6|nr:hypothetical protein [Rubinisphaera margarita]MCG6157769.1 hypothetical protein [Rubinisphaera margarita]
MKGPGLRSKLDVRRVWKCPQTGKILRTPGSITQMISPFTRDTCWMEFIEEQRPAREQRTLETILEHMQIDASAEGDPPAEPRPPKKKKGSSRKEATSETPSDDAPEATEATADSTKPEPEQTSPE